MNLVLICSDSLRGRDGLALLNCTQMDDFYFDYNDLL